MCFVVVPAVAWLWCLFVTFLSCVWSRYEADLEAARQEINKLNKKNARLETAVDAQIVRAAVAKSKNNDNIRDGTIGDVSNKLKVR